MQVLDLHFTGKDELKLYICLKLSSILIYWVGQETRDIKVEKHIKAMVLI